MISNGLTLDTETYLIRPGCKAPPVVCISWCPIQDNRIGAAGIDGGLDSGKRILDRLIGWLQSSVVIYNANIAYDVMTTCTLAAQEYGYDAAEELFRQWFAKYDRDEVADVLTNQKILDLSAGCYRGYERHGKWVHFGYSLNDVAHRYTGRSLQKGEDSWRLRYGELALVPLNLWPQEAINYPLEDAVAPAIIAVKQQEIPEATALNFPGLDPLRDQWAQARGAMWLSLCSCWGIRTWGPSVTKFAKEVEQEYYRVAEELCPIGLAWKEYSLERKKLVDYIAKLGGLDRLLVPGEMGAPPKVSLRRESLQSLGHPVVTLASTWPIIQKRLTDPNYGPAEKSEAWQAFQVLEAAGLASLTYHKSTKAAADRMTAVCRSMGRDVRCTDKGNVALDKETCDSFGDDALKSYAELGSLSKTMSTDLKFLREGAYQPIHTHFEEYLDTSRTGSSAPNLQNIRRLPGIRECFVPREGFDLLDGDFKMLELHTLAQICLWVLGKSDLAVALNNKKDPHTQVAATILRITYEQAEKGKEAGDDVISNTRDCGKVANFGFPGGLGPDTLQTYAAKSYGVKMTRDQCVSLKYDWFGTWTEMPDYFKYVNSCESYPGSGSYNMVQPYSGRLRADATFCAGCNDGFQGLGASVAKLAGWRLIKAMYTDRSDALYGARMVNFIHDQFLIECRRDRLTEASVSMARHMALAAKEILPDVNCTASVLASRVWSKKAKRVEVNGVLLPWEYKELAA